MGAANTLVREQDGSIIAHNTDAPALREELEELGDASFRDRSVIILGSGGAARAALVALAALGTSRILVRSRNLEHAAKLGAIDPRVAVEVQPLDAPAEEREDLVAIVQATTCGMTGGPPGEVVASAVAWPSVPSRTVALDVVYSPRETPFLVAARARGLAVADGIGMLARQGSLAFQLWLGVIPPLDVMREALLKPQS
jgi:shikimate dehydrogenase